MKPFSIARSLFFAQKLIKTVGIFLLLYLTCNWISSQREDLHEFYFNWELTLPFYPWMIFIYISAYLYPIVQFLYLEEKQIASTGFATEVCAYIASIIFILFPAKLGFARTVPTGYEKSFERLFTIDLPHNLLPSLHVAFATLWTLVLFEVLPKWGRWVIGIHCFLVWVSVILVRQHHFLDIVFGFILGLVGYFWAYKRAMEDNFTKVIS
ncbi:MAG: phosphatase PAP2 family protein [Bacteriovoracaceae bacterium]